MNKTELTFLIFAILALAVLCGWGLRWLWSLVARRLSPDEELLDDVAERLHLAEAAREAAEARVAELEAALATERAAREEDAAAAERRAEELTAEVDRWSDAYAALRG